MKIKPIKTMAYIGSKVALPATVLSTFHKGGYFERVAGSAWDLVEGAYGLGNALIQNTGIGSIATNVMTSGLEALNNFGHNIVENPKETAIAAGITYGVCKVPKMVINYREKRNEKKAKKGLVSENNKLKAENAQLRGQLRTA